MEAMKKAVGMRTTGGRHRRVSPSPRDDCKDKAQEKIEYKHHHDPRGPGGLPSSDPFNGSGVSLEEEIRGPEERPALNGVDAGLCKNGVHDHRPSASRNSRADSRASLTPVSRQNASSRFFSPVSQS